MWEWFQETEDTQYEISRARRWIKGATTAKWNMIPLDTNWKTGAEHSSELPSQGTRELGLLPTNSHPSMIKGYCFREANSTAFPTEQAPAANESPQARRLRDLRQEGFLAFREGSTRAACELLGWTTDGICYRNKTRPPNYEATSKTLYSTHLNSNVKYLGVLSTMKEKNTN